MTSLLTFASTLSHYLDRLSARTAKPACLAVGLGLWLSGATAQPSNQEPNWYQVEVVVFERLAGDAAGDQEIWPKNVQLFYPNNWQKLLSPEQAVTLRTALTTDTAADTTTQITETPSEAAGTDPSVATSAEQSPASAADALQNLPVPPVLRLEDYLELGFVRLPAEARTLNESKGAIDRNRNMRVLFHEAWRQPIVAADDAASIIVRGGNAYGDHKELEGSIRISISRYLHLHTHLWLTQFMPNYGQEPEHWPPLPPVPEYQPVSFEQNEPAFTLDADDESDSLWQIDTTAISEYSSLIKKPFLIKQIVTLQQTRRMRSGELHYLDHPRIGLLIKVDTYQPEPDDL